MPLDQSYANVNSTMQTSTTLTIRVDDPLGENYLADEHECGSLVERGSGRLFSDTGSNDFLAEYVFL